jgi:transposase
LEALLAAGRAASRELTHARVLLKADQGPQGAGWADDEIAEALEVSRPTIERIRQRYVSEGLEAALHPRRTRVYRRKVDGYQEAHLIALACSAPPAGQQRWTLRLLADKMVELAYIDAVSHETIRQVLKKTNSSRG